MKEVELESSARSEFFKGTKAKLDVLQAVQKRVHMPCLEVVAVAVESCRLSVVVEASSGGFELSAVVVGATGADALEKVGKKAACRRTEPRMCHLVDLVKSPHSPAPSPYPAPH